MNKSVELNMWLKYKLSEEAVKRLFREAKDHKVKRTVYFDLADLSPQAREAWLKMFGVENNAELRTFHIEGGQIYRDGSVSDKAPTIDNWSGDWLELDKILAPEDVSDAILTLYQQYQDTVSELGTYRSKWEKALAKYRERKAAEAEAEAKAKAERKARQEITVKTLVKPWIEEVARLADLANRKAKVTEVFHALTGVEEDPAVAGFSFLLSESIEDEDHDITCYFVVKSTREPPDGMRVGGPVEPKAIANQAFINVASKLLKDAKIEFETYERVIERCRNCEDVIKVEYGLWITKGNVRVHVTEEYSCDCYYDC